MKKLIMMLMALCMFATATDAQNKNLEKQLKKEYKKKMKEYKA